MLMEEWSFPGWQNTKGSIRGKEWHMQSHKTWLGGPFRKPQAATCGQSGVSGRRQDVGVTWKECRCYMLSGQKDFKHGHILQGRIQFSFLKRSIRFGGWIWGNKKAWHKQSGWKVVRVIKERVEENPDSRAISEQQGQDSNCDYFAGSRSISFALGLAVRWSLQSRRAAGPPRPLPSPPLAHPCSASLNYLMAWSFIYYCFNLY